MCEKTFAGQAVRLVSYSKTENTFQPTTAWMPVSGAADDIAFILFMQSVQGTFEASPAVQLASVRPDEPDLPIAIPTGSYQNTNGYHFLSESEGALSLKTKMFWRFGVMFNGGADGFGQADVALQTSFDTRGRMLGRGSIQYQPTNDSTGATSVSMYPISDWSSVVGAGSVKAGFVISSSMNSALKYGLYVRYANDRNAPGQWQAVGTTTTAPTGNSNSQTGEVGLTPGSNGLFQLAVGLSDASSVEARATVHVVAMAMG